MIDHNTVYFFTSSMSMRIVQIKNKKEEELCNNKRNDPEIIGFKWGEKNAFLHNVVSGWVYR